MSEKELNSYRFISGQEPSDEVLSRIVKEVAQEAAESNQKAAKAHFEQMKRNLAIKNKVNRANK